MRMVRVAALSFFIAFGVSPVIATSAAGAPTPTTTTSRLNVSGGSGGSGGPSGASVAMRVLDFPTFLGPDGTLKITLAATNNGASSVENLRVFLAIHDLTETRSRLHATFAQPSPSPNTRASRTRSLNLGPVVGSDTVSVDGAIAPGETRTIEIDKPLHDISLFRDASEEASGSYPVVIALRSGSEVLSTVQTHLIFFARTIFSPLGLGLVIPLHFPSIYQRGDKPDLVTSKAFEKALDGGRIDNILSAIESAAGAPITLAPSGQFLDELADVSDGYNVVREGREVHVSASDPLAKKAEATLTRLKELTKRPEIRFIAFPYSAAFLPAFVKSDLAEIVQGQILADRRRLSDLLGVKPLEGWFLPYQGAIDDRTVSQLQPIGISQIILAGRSLLQPSRGLTRATPVKMRSRSGDAITGLIEDEDIEAGLKTSRGEGLSMIQVRQRFLSESVTIMGESPSKSRAILVVTPLDWDPEGDLVRSLITSVGTSPWMHATTPDQILADLSKPQDRTTADLAPSETVLPPGLSVPGPEYFNAVKRARDSIEDYRDLGAGAVTHSVEIERHLLIAESADWWSSRARIEQGLAFATDIPTAVKAEFHKIKAPASQTITLTSHTGVIPLSISSLLAYPVDVVVRLNSDKLRFLPSANLAPCQHGTSDQCIFISKLQKLNHTLEVKTVAQTTGTFPLRVIIETPSQGITIDHSQLNIRSTAYNRVAVTITAGAATFLVAWWFASVARKRLGS